MRQCRARYLDEQTTRRYHVWLCRGGGCCRARHLSRRPADVHKVLMEMYAFFLNWSAAWWRRSGKSRKGRGGKATQSRVTSKNKAAKWSWKDQIVPILMLIAKVLKLKTSKIWTVSGERDTFIGCLTAPTYHAMEMSST
ncbi:non-SMC mitotic condensation complex subunit 1 [Lactifluus volemus]|nr:non-SMC mitotic condensation complex subunit 1 [Lactifluus volemus]